LILFEVAEWQSFWSSFIIYCVLLIFLTIQQVAPLLLALAEVCALLSSLVSVV